MNRTLTRSRDSVIGGVAAGVAKWINADRALVRIGWALLVPLTGGAALLAYIVAWIVVPEEPRNAVQTDAATADAGPLAGGVPAPAVVPSAPEERGESRAPLIIGGGLVLIGLWFLAREYLPAIDWDFVWPLILVGIGLAILVTSLRRR